VPVFALSTVLAPWQNDVAPVMVAMGRLLTVTEVEEEVAEQPLRFVTVTEYDP
jgi:hypothetical protein